jgi:hypothetical protein
VATNTITARRAARSSTAAALTGGVDFQQIYSGATADPRKMVAQSIGRLGAERKLAGVVLAAVDEAKVPPYGPCPCHSNQLYNSYNRT